MGLNLGSTTSLSLQQGGKNNNNKSGMAHNSWRRAAHIKTAHSLPVPAPAPPQPPACGQHQPLPCPATAPRGAAGTVGQGEGVPCSSHGPRVKAQG